MHEKKSTRKMVGIPEVTGRALELQLAKINKARLKLTKEPLTRVDLICDAILNYTVEMGIEK